MDDLIVKILQMDETARKMNEEAQAEKIASREEVKKKHREVYEEYLESAKAHVEQYKKTAEETSEKEWSVTKKHYDALSLKLEKTFNKNKDKWVDEIVGAVLEEPLNKSRPAD